MTRKPSFALHALAVAVALPTAVLVAQPVPGAFTVAETGRSYANLQDAVNAIGNSRAISADVAGVRVIGGYFPNGQEPGSDKFEYKMEWLTALRRWVKDELAAHPNLVLMGDYNITFDEDDVWDPVNLEGTIHCTEEERYHLRALVALGLCDSYRLFPYPPKSFSWWDYRDAGFRRNRGMRIDHILVSQALKPRVTGCVIDKTPRKNERPSDHAPVVVQINPAPAPESSE